MEDTIGNEIGGTSDNYIQLRWTKRPRVVLVAGGDTTEGSRISGL